MIIASRHQEKAEQSAVKQLEAVASRSETSVEVQAMDNNAAASAADIVVLTVPFAHRAGTRESVRAAVQGKIPVDVSLALMPSKVARLQLPEEASAGQMARKLPGENVQTVTVFQYTAAVHAQDDSDCSDDRSA